MNEKHAIRKAVLIVAIANLAYFFVEFVVALRIGSVSLFADSIDFLEDASINLLIYFAINWTLPQRAKAGMLLAAIILVPCLATLWAVWQQIMSQHPPAGGSLSLVGLGALIVNCGCAYILTQYRKYKGSLMRAAFLSARNDAAANLAIVITGGLTMLYPSIWPDIIVGLGIAALNANAAREVYEAAREELKEAKS
jgi:Co/Zn/Cd efflux system component